MRCRNWFILFLMVGFIYGCASGSDPVDNYSNKKDDLLLDAMVEIELPEIHQEREYIKPVTFPDSLSLRILLGKPKKEYQAAGESRFKMQLNEKFSEPENISFFIDKKKQGIPESDRKNISIKIIADQNIPLKNIKPIIQKLRELKIKNIWIAYYRENQKTYSLLEFVHASAFNFSSNKNLKEYIPIKIGQKKTTIPSPKKEIEISETIPINPFDIEDDLLTIIRKSSNQLSGTKYSAAKKTDCSGMFHKLINTFKNDYPKHQFPHIKNARSSRDIGLWYYKNGDFTIIRDVKKSSHLIQPGMVMFYGYGNSKIKYNRKKLNMQTLISRNVGINHVAVVTHVHIKNGVLESYDIFHGRNPKHPAGITTSRRVYLNRPQVPSYGNGMEPWLGIAPILIPKK